MLISAPANFDFRILNKLENKIHDTYGSLNNYLGIPHALPDYLLPDISLAKLGDYVSYSHAKGIKFNYILSHPSIAHDKNVIVLLGKLNKINVDIITVSNKNLIAFIKKEYPFEICASIACKIDSFESAIAYKNLGVDILCVFYSKNKDLEFIKLLKKKTQIRVKLLVNNCCFPECPYTAEHFTKTGYLEKTPLKCLKLKLENPSIIEKCGFIHPNDLRMYEEAGVDFIKIAGRTKPSYWVINCVNAYYRGNYKGNSFRLMNALGSGSYEFPFAYLFCIVLPNFLFRFIFKFLYLLTDKKIFKVFLKEKNIKQLVKVYLVRDPFYINDKIISVDRNKSNYLLKEIEKILGNERGLSRQGQINSKSTDVK